MSNGAALCLKLRELHGLGSLKSPFRFEDVLRIARVHVKATPAGQKYAALAALQSCCTSNEQEFAAFKAGDPRKFRNVMDVKRKWQFTLIEADIGSTRGRQPQEKPAVEAKDPNKMKLSDRETMDRIKVTFESVCAARTPKDLDEIVLNDPVLRKNAMSDRKYPQLRFRLDAAELDELTRQGILSDDGMLNIVGHELSTLEKLLYGIVWKNGDLGKESHIVRGVKSSHSREAGRKGLVFFSFGRHLADKSNPIIDQHVIRAFKLFELSQSRAWGSLAEVRSSEKVDQETIDRYAAWLENINEDLPSYPGYRFHVDKVLFALGKTVKSSKSKKS